MLLRPPSNIQAVESPRQVIFEDFKIDLPISGGWGYEINTACVIDKNDPSVPKTLTFNGVEIEYIFVEKRIYEEMIIFRSKGEQFSGLRWKLLEQETLSENGKNYDYLSFEVLGFSDSDWEELTDRLKAIQSAGKTELMAELDKLREAKAQRFKKEFFFEISSFY